MNKPRSLTIKDLAATLRVSHATVSRALADSPRISEQTKALVRQAAADGGYIAHSSARVTRGSSNPVVGLVVPDVQTDFFSALTRALAQECNAHKLNLLLCLSQYDPEVEERQIKALCEARPLGIAIYPTIGLTNLSRKMLLNAHTVQVGRAHPQLQGAGFAGMEDAASMQVLIRHLLAMGHRRIGFIGSNPTMSPGLDRLNGYLEALRGAAVEPDSSLILSLSPLQDEGREAMRRLLDEQADPPTAVAVSSAPMAMGALDLLHQRQVRIPQDLSFIGFGDPPWYKFWGPGITTAELPIEEVAHATIAHLLRKADPHHVAGPGADTPLHVRYRTRVVLRGTTAPPPRRA